MKLTTNDEIQLNSLVGTGTRTLQVSDDGTIIVGASTSTTIASAIGAAAPPTTSWLGSNAQIGSGITTTNFTANTIFLTPYVTPRTFTYTGLSVNVSTAVASTNCKILIYDDLNGVPKNRIFVSTALSKATTGIKTYYENGTMSAGTLYWMGVINDTSTGQLRTINNNNANIFLPFVAASPQQEVFGYLYTSSYASPATSLTASVIAANSNDNQTPIIYFQTIPFAP
jgi:hypothetical protein